MRVLLADDHGIVRDGLRWMLAGEPDVEIVGEVSDGGELLDRLTGPCDDVDVVLLDIRMPGVGGLDALRDLRARGRAGPAVLVLSMHHEPAIVRRAIELGASGYLLKSTTRDQLLEALRHVAAGRCFVQSALTAPLLDQVAGRCSAAELPRLTPREVDVLRSVAAGRSSKCIAVELGISEATVKSHLKEIFTRLGCANRAEAVATALRLGLIDAA